MLNKNQHKVVNLKEDNEDFIDITVVPTTDNQEKKTEKLETKEEELQELIKQETKEIQKKKLKKMIKRTKNGLKSKK